MKNVIKLELQESQLARWSGADAKLWMYHVTHKRLALMLSKFDEPEVLYIVAVGCAYITGPFSWKKANISIIDNSNPSVGEPIHYVLDEQAGFKLSCSSVTLVTGSAVDLDTTFENFLGDAPERI